MKEDYSFSLEWDELDEDLKELKIGEYILHNTEEYEARYRDMHKLPDNEKVLLKDMIDDDEIRNNAYKAIEARFPIYF